MRQIKVEKYQAFGAGAKFTKRVKKQTYKNFIACRIFYKIDTPLQIFVFCSKNLQSQHFRIICTKTFQITNLQINILNIS